ncbi:hypothetical protein ABT55_08305 [Enterobacter ludwigii]|jgi:hypothetical protein|nr:hypothetical protein ABT55_08305 [Enterobacter ludwigii]
MRIVARKGRLKRIMQIGKGARFSPKIHMTHECDLYHFKVVRSASIIRRVKPSLPDGEGFLLDWFLRYTQH